MSFETNNTGSSAALPGKQDNVVDAVYDFSTLCDELDDGSSVEDNEDASILFEHVGNDDELEFEFATDMGGLSAATFEEEAFGVKRHGKQDSQAPDRQAQSSIWKKNPFALESSKEPSLLKGDNRLKKVPYRSNAPPPSNREISAGISFASITSGTAPPLQAGNDAPLPHDATLDETIPDHNPQTTDPPPIAVPVPTLHAKDPFQPSSKALEEPPSGELHMNDSQQSRPAIYSLTDIEAKMIQQSTAPKKNLLYQLLPGLASQQQSTSSQPPPTEPVDINSFFKKHQSQRTEQVNHIPQPSIHKPNLTPEQERKQQEEDDTKASYDGLMTTKNMEFINHLEQSQLATHSQGSSGDFYYEMYQAHINNGGQPHLQSAHHHPHPSAMKTANDMPPLSMGENEKCAELDQILKDIMKDRSDTITEPSRSKNDRQLLLKSIESIYFLVLEVEQSSQHPGATLPSHFENRQPSAKSPSETRQETMDKIWGMLTTSQSSSPTVISILSVNKGMSLIARLLPHLNDHQRLIIMTTIAYYFVDLLLQSNDANMSQQQQQQRQTMDYLHPSITGCLENTLFCASLSYIIHIISSLSHHPDFETLIATVTGQRFVGSLVFHGRGKRHQQQPSVPDVDVDQWQVAFDTLFDSTKACFPQIKGMARLDNVGLWMLLNSLAACCNEQQKEAIANDFREPLSMAMQTISGMTRTHPLPYLPFPIQAAYPILNELWVNLGPSIGFGDPST